MMKCDNIFVHATGLKESLNEGDKVSYEEEEGEKVKAAQVVVIED
jgi:CspA family cold shock protein